MNRRFIVIVLLTLCNTLYSQEWTIPIEMGFAWSANDVFSVDNGESTLVVGYTLNEDGFVLKMNKDGEYNNHIVHLSGRILRYHCGIQLDNGNYMVFGVCDDSLCDPDFPKHIRIDVFNNDLESVASKVYDVEDDVFDCFAFATDGLLMRSIQSSSGTVILAVAPSYYIEQYNYYQRAIQFYEMDIEGNIITKKSHISAYVDSIVKLTHEPHSNDLLVAVNGGSFPSHSGVPGIYVVDTDLNIVERQHLTHIQGGIGPNADNIIEIATDGKWIDGDLLIFSFRKSVYQRPSFSYTSLYKLDSALVVFAESQLPPYDSCTWMSKGTNTAYINDSTIFAFTSCAESMNSFDTHQINVILVDNHLNLLGRKTIKRDATISLAGMPSVFNDGGCVVPIYVQNGWYFQGDPFDEAYLVKFRREDIEITWDVVKKNETNHHHSPYPNPASSIINIPIDQTLDRGSRLQIFDMKGVKYFDCEITKIGNLITIDTQNFEKGLYIYHISSNDHSILDGKFVKQ